ncbi:hypothetical protein ACFY2D_01810 [Streptomyces nigra]|uniref:hypothetical protein n=1 Tax=Streptomyces nigra TaxID=1827580 RepID=UPI0036768BD2
MSFRKLPENQHEIVVRDREGPDVRLPAQPVGPTMPHDLVHAVVETALGIEDGFWGATARGSTFQGFPLVTPGLPTEGRGAGPALLTAYEPARTGPRLDTAAARWAAVPEGGALVWRRGTDR